MNPIGYQKLLRCCFITRGLAVGITIRIGFLPAPAPAAVINSAHSMPWPKSRVTKPLREDYRAWDMPGWPTTQSHALLIRATRADAPLERLDLSLLGTCACHLGADSIG